MNCVETRPEKVEQSITELLQQAPHMTRLDASATVWGFTLRWIDVGDYGFQSARLIVYTQDWERFRGIVSRVTALRKRKSSARRESLAKRQGELRRSA